MCFVSPSLETREKKTDDGAGNGEAKLITVPVFEIRQLLANREQVNAFLAEYGPPVLDPFCGGGSIPLEAQRLGLRAYASDLNPVPVLITKALIEIPPKFADLPPVNPEWQKKSKEEKAAKAWQGAKGLADDVRYYGKWMRNEAEKRIGCLYPKIKVTKGNRQRPAGPQGVCGRRINGHRMDLGSDSRVPKSKLPRPPPLVRSFWLSKKKGKQCYARPIIDRGAKTVRFEIATKGEPPKHTTDRTAARCLFCDTFIEKPQLRDISVAHGVPEMPLAVVADGKGERPVSSRRHAAAPLH